MEELEQAVLKKIMPDTVPKKAPEKISDKTKVEPVIKKGEKQ